MSKWTDFRDSVIDSLKFDEVTEEMKKGLTVWLAETVMPLATTAAASFVEQTKAQAANESGWCKVRDLIVLPLVIEGGLGVIQKVLDKTKEA